MSDYDPPEPPDMDPPPPNEGAGASQGGGGGKKRRQIKTNAAHVARLHRDFAYQYGSDIAWDRSNRLPIKISHLRHTFGNSEVRKWMESEKRQMVQAEEVLFDPAERCDRNCVNLFAGWGVEPKAGDTKPFFDVLSHLCGHDDAVMTWVLNWFAYPLQHPGAKLPTALVFHGAEGTGKNLLCETVAQIHGQHAKVVGQRELESQWNDWASARTFCIGDEVVSRQELKHHKGVLKALITSSDINITTKFMNLRAERNCMNIVFLSNEIQPLALDPTDRRYLVVWTQRKGAAELYSAFVAWREAGGAAALMHELLERDLSDWQAYAPPPMTHAKEQLIELGRLSPERFWREWRATAIYGLPHRTCSSDQAYRAYKHWCVLEGERFPMSKAVFARMVAREADEALAVRPMWDGKGTVRMWQVTPPPDGVGPEWVRECVQEFDELLRDWRGEQVAPA